jgi:two-component system, chemotaxis family, sensor kinase CheA
MNEFLTQFLIESREFVEQATEGLLVLEQSPQDAERLDSVFRAFHTLKGGAGIVEFAAMEHAVHAAEEILSSARSGKRTLTPALVGDCLACLDQVVQWLDELERTGELPSSAAESGASDAWLAEMLGRNPGVRARVATALKFIPAADCFYQGEDPLARVTALPELLALDVEPVVAWPALNELDPYHCNLALTALTAASMSEVTDHMRGHSGTCEIRAIDSARVAPQDGGLPSQAREILDAQRDLLAHATPANLAGFVASAGLTAENVLRFCARPDAAALVAQATEKSLAESSPEPLRISIAQLLSGKPAAVTEIAKPSVRPEGPAQTLRIEAARVDALVRLTGELTVAKNAAGHVAKLAQEESNSLAGVLKERHGILSRLIAELQESVLAMRVLPLRSVLQRFPRVVREMSAHLGKAVKLEIEGDDTEADKTIVEMLFEPLLHIVRNAIDHGIESPADRAARGKPATARIHIRAARQGDQVLLEISDDGGGIDVDRVREVAKARGIATEEELRAMSEMDIVDLVFAAGFSTAAKVTELSGRGVGMDAVRTAVERIGGRVSIESQAGHGTTVRFSLPFSVMMTHVMTVEAGGQMFGVPLDAIVETVSVPRNSIMGIGAAQAIVLRNRTIPVLDLASVLALREASRGDASATIVIAAVAGHLGGLQVDRIGERLEVILKPLDGLLSGMPGITGTTLLGDGRVLLVLDIGELLK